jgi:hypothetical protein
MVAALESSEFSRLLRGKSDILILSEFRNDAAGANLRHWLSDSSIGHAFYKSSGSVYLNGGGGDFTAEDAA